MNFPIPRRGVTTSLVHSPANRASRAIGVLSFSLAATVAPHVVMACATCGCTLSSDAAMGYSATAGWRLNVEYDYIHQDQLRSGTRSISGVPDGNELERETLNRYITTGLSYSPNSDLEHQPSGSVCDADPLNLRRVRFYQPLPDLSSSRSSAWAMSVSSAAYQGMLPTHNLGIQLGVKLPTGHYGTAVNFYGGPNAGDAARCQFATRHRQHGCHRGRLLLPGNQPRLRFLRQRPVPKRRQASYGSAWQRLPPGKLYDSEFRDCGMRAPALGAQLQMNLLHKSRDQGALADIQSTAGNVAYISPGLTAKVVTHLHVFGFVQVPIYSNLYGYQLFPRYTVSVGASYAL